MRLPGTMIRILAEQNHFYIFKGRMIESGKYPLAWWIHGLIFQSFSDEEVLQGGEIRCVKFILELHLPAFFYFRVHFCHLENRWCYKGIGQISAKTTLFKNVENSCIAVPTKNILLHHYSYTGSNIYQNNPFTDH